MNLRCRWNPASSSATRQPQVPLCPVKPADRFDEELFKAGLSAIADLRQNPLPPVARWRLQAQLSAPSPYSPRCRSRCQVIV
jgi:hypothetical protein